MVCPSGCIWFVNKWLFFVAQLWLIYWLHSNQCSRTSVMNQMQSCWTPGTPNLRFSYAALMNKGHFVCVCVCACDLLPSVMWRTKTIYEKWFLSVFSLCHLHWLTDSGMFKITYKHVTVEWVTLALEGQFTPTWWKQSLQRVTVTVIKVQTVDFKWH